MQKIGKGIIPFDEGLGREAPEFLLRSLMLHRAKGRHALEALPAFL